MPDTLLLSRRGSWEPTFPGSLHTERYSHLLLQAQDSGFPVMLQGGGLQGRGSQASVAQHVIRVWCISVSALRAKPVSRLVVVLNCLPACGLHRQRFSLCPLLEWQSTFLF